MDITEVRIKLVGQSDDRLQAFSSITFDDSFAVRDLKIIEGHNGPFVAMPSRKISVNCRKCSTKNHLRANFCNQCGKRLDAIDFDDGRTKLYADIAHPINTQCREKIQDRVVTEFLQEVEASQDPDYVSQYDDNY